LSVTVSVPARAPKTVGVKVTLIMQFAPAASVAGLIGQAVAPVLVAAKSPEAAIVLIVRAAVPVFVNVTVCAVLVVLSTWLPKDRVVGANPTPGAAPDPLRLTSNVCELEIPPSVTVTVMASVALSPEAVDGVNVTPTVHEAPAAMLAPQLLEGEAKSVALVPVNAILVPGKGIGSEVLFVRDTVIAAEVTPTG
jgi:hypothetical protein